MYSSVGNFKARSLSHTCTHIKEMHLCVLSCEMWYRPFLGVWGQSEWKRWWQEGWRDKERIEGFVVLYRDCGDGHLHMEGVRFGWSTQEKTARSCFVGDDDRLTMCTSSLSRKKPIAYGLHLSYINIMYVINKSRILILQYERRIHTILPMHLIRASVKTNLHHEVSYHWPLVPLCISMCRVSKLGSDDRYVGLYAAFFAIGNLDRPKATTYTQGRSSTKSGNAPNCKWKWATAMRCSVLAGIRLGCDRDCYWSKARAPARQN